VKSTRTNIGFFAAGFVVFCYLVYRFGPGQIVANVGRAGWSLVWIALVWLGIYILNTIAWRLVLGADAGKIGLSRLFMVTVSGFVINYITPFIALGGEPYKIRSLAGILGGPQSLSAVVLYRMVHLLGHMFLLLAGIALAMLVLPLPLSVQIVCAISGVAIAGIILLTLSGHRGGIFARLQRVLARVVRSGKFRERLRAFEGSADEMDEVITRVYHHHRGKFVLAILSEFLSRVLMGIEVYLILAGIGIGTSIPEALFLYVTYSIMINVLFFIPLNLGAREGGLALGLGSLALPPLLGVYLGVVMRIREFVWILIGLLFILLTTGSTKASSPDTV
jgi:uncharacterized protein (TIRG00374 family)